MILRTIINMEVYITLMIFLLSCYRVETVLDLTLSGKELQKMLFGSDDDIRVIENGVVSDILRNNLTDTFPPIKPEYNEITIKFASERRMYYEMYLSSSDETIMSMPTVTVPYVGRLEKDWIQFNIRFPCKRKNRGGIVTMGIIMDFFLDEDHKQFFKRINLSMRRQCKKAKPPGPRWQTVKDGCFKRCDLINFKRKFCLSDFVARVKVNEVVMVGNQKHYLVHVPRKRIFRKPYSRKIILKKRNQKILVRGDSLTCHCKPLEVGKRYLVFGREDHRRENLYFDNYSIAFEVNKNNEHAMAIMRSFRKEYRGIKCPPNLYRHYGGRDDYYHYRNHNRHQYEK